MSQTQATELLQAVQTFLRQQVLPQLEGFDAYTTRVAANSLAIVARDYVGRDALQRLDQAAAARWELGDAAAATRDLSLALKNRDIDINQPLLDYLRARSLHQLGIDNPRYSGFHQGCERWPRLAPGSTGDTESSSS